MASKRQVNMILRRSSGTLKIVSSLSTGEKPPLRRHLNLDGKHSFHERRHISSDIQRS
jgi:hypothetical protein